MARFIHLFKGLGNGSNAVDSVERPSSEVGPHGPLGKGNKDDIRVIGAYERGKKGLLTLHAYDGQNWEDGTPHTTTWATQQTQEAKALAEGPQFVQHLRHAWDEKYGATAEVKADAGNAAAPWGSTLARMQEVLEELKAEGISPNTLTNYVSEARAFLELLGPKRARRRPELFKPDEIKRICECRLKKFDADTGTPGQSLRKLKFLLTRAGFSQECIAAIKKVRRRRGTSKKNSSEYPFYDSEVRVIWNRLPFAKPLAQGLCYVGACGTMHISDAVMAKWSHFDEAEEAVVRARRIKTGNPFQYGIWPELRAWLKTRPRTRGDIYIFPELVFTKKQLRDPKCNKAPVKNEKEVAHNAERRAWDVFDDFLRNLCQIKRDGLSFRSFRTYNCSELVGAGYEPRLVMSLSGHQDEENFLRYLTGLPKHIRRLAERNRQHYLAVAAGREDPVYLTVTEGVEHLSLEIQASQSKIESAISSIPGLVLQSLCKLARNGFRVEPDGSVVIRLPGLLESAAPVNLNGPGDDGRQLCLPFPGERRVTAGPASICPDLTLNDCESILA